MLKGWDWGSQNPSLPLTDGKTEANSGDGVAQVAGTGPALGWVPGGGLRAALQEIRRGIHMGSYFLSGGPPQGPGLSRADCVL